MLMKQFLENASDIASRQGATKANRQTQSCELVHHREAFQLSAVFGLVIDKVVAPDVVWELSPLDPLRCHTQYLLELEPVKNRIVHGPVLGETVTSVTFPATSGLDGAVQPAPRIHVSGTA